MSRPAQALWAVIATGLVMAGGLVATGVSADVPTLSDLTRDPTTVAGVPWWTGSISRLVNLVWAAAATVNLLAARATAPSLHRPLLLLGVLCTVLAVDDTMLVHEQVLPSLGVPEEVMLAGYAVVGLWMAAQFWPLRQTAVGAAFFAGGALLAISVAVDAFLHFVVVEDTAKLAGVLAWCLCGVWAHSQTVPTESRASQR